jgi:hypothetical protein
MAKPRLRLVASTTKIEQLHHGDPKMEIFEPGST